MSARLLGVAIAVAGVAVLSMVSPALVLAGTPPSSAAAYGNIQRATSGATSNGSDITVNAGIQESGSAQGTHTASAGPDACTWTVMTNQVSLDQLANLDSWPGSINGNTQGPPTGTDPTTGTWYTVSCPVNWSVVSIWVATPTGGGPQPKPATPLAVAQDAVAGMHLASPTVHMSPPSGAEVVNFSDWLWVDPSSWQPISATASVGGVSATATASPDRVVWDMGDGREVTCSGPGTAYDTSLPPGGQQTACSYVYPSSSAGQPGNRYTATVRVYWHVTWTATGAPGGGNLGDIAGDPATVSVEVDEIQALNGSAG